MPYKDNEKKKEYSRRWHKDHYTGSYKQDRLDNAKARHIEVKKRFKEYKSTLSCLSCGESDECCLDFHHRDPTKKDLPVSRAITNNWSWKRLMEEVEKCEILCANCHRKLHRDIATALVK